jgi:MoaA/NifB/PqqE/SkfB family radical SAM enzyme
MTRSKGFFERTVDTISNLLKVGISPRVKAVVTPFNFRQVRSYIEQFSSLGVRDFMFTLYGRSYYRHSDTLFMTEEMKRETADVLSSIVEKRSELSIQGDAVEYIHDTNDQNIKSELWKERAYCSGGRTNLGIAPDGHAVLCEQMPLSSPYFVGDLTKQSISEIWNSPNLLKFVYPPPEYFTGSPCHDCPDFQDCIYKKGHCFRESYFHYGDLFYPQPNCPKAPISKYRTT